MQLSSCAMPKPAQLSAPNSNAKEGGKDQAHWGTEEPTTFLCAFPGHAMAWKGTGQGSGAVRHGRREGTVFLSGNVAVTSKEGKEGVGQSLCSGPGQRGEGRQKPMAVIHSASVQMRHPEPALVLPFLWPEGDTSTCGNKTLGQAHLICRTLHYI